MPVVTVNDIALFHEVHGAGGPAFVLVHGGMCDHHDWDRLIPALAATHRVIAVDLRAHGRSSADPGGFTIEQCAADLNELLDALDIAPAVLVGHSFGTRIVAEAAWSRPDNAAGLVLIDGSRSIGGHAATAPSESASTLPMAATLDAVLAATIGPHLVGSERQRIVDTMGSASPALMAACVAQIESWDRARADRVFVGLPRSLPVLAIQSTYHDRYAPRRSLTARDATTPFLDFLREAVLTMRTAILPDTGHFSMIERPADVAALLIAFATAAPKPERPSV